MSKAEAALKSAPGVLAVTVDFKASQATIGTKAGSRVPTDEILAALKSIGYSGEFVEPPPAR
ncbi:MAG: heavy metal-associated domain-containing protein [Pirellulaceae bacterium]